MEEGYQTITLNGRSVTVYKRDNTLLVTTPPLDRIVSYFDYGDYTPLCFKIERHVQHEPGSYDVVVLDKIKADISDIESMERFLVVCREAETPYTIDRSWRKGKW